jgi:RHS repeat-associated protein
MDDQSRIAIIETLTVNNGIKVQDPTNIQRYQLRNHLNSSALEVNELAEIISYEEFHPFGTTSYQSVSSNIEVSKKVYRYTGKEKDEETGLYYHGARYYAPWLGRWTAVDPMGL